jgi:hypothetical protein
MKNNIILIYQVRYIYTINIVHFYTRIYYVQYVLFNLFFIIIIIQKYIFILVFIIYNNKICKREEIL